MKFSLSYLRTWLIIKRKQLLNLFPSKENSYTKFAIVCAPRSGSTWLHTLLNSHPQIISYGEILREHNEKYSELPAVSSLVFHTHNKSIRAVGLKLFYEYHLQDAYSKSFREVIDDPTIKIIHLTRDDKKAQYESLLRAQSTREWSSGTPAKEITPVPFNPIAYDQYREEQLQSEKTIAALFQNHNVLTVRYETLRDHTHNTCFTIVNFLNARPRTLFSLLQKQTP